MSYNKEIAEKVGLKVTKVGIGESYKGTEEQFAKADELQKKEDDREYVSNCCGAEMYGMWEDSEICPDCREHCGLEEVEE